MSHFGKKISRQYKTTEPYNILFLFKFYQCANRESNPEPTD